MPDQLMLRGIKDPISVQHQVNPITDLYQMFQVGQPFIQDVNKVTAVPMTNILSQQDPLRRDIDPLQTSLEVIEPFRYEDGIKRYGYSDFLNQGDNEDRYAQGFRRENPNKFYTGWNPLKYIYKGVYWGGAFLEKTLESAVVKTGQGLSSLYGLSIGNTVKLLEGESYDSFADWVAKSSDNVFSSVFNNWDGWLKDRYHYYQEASDRTKKGFAASLGDGDFWMNDVSDGLGFLVSAMFEVGLISKLGLGTKAASRLAPLSRGVSTEALLAEGAAGTGSGVLRTGLQRAGNFLGMEGSGHAFVKNAVDLTSQTLAVTTIESAMEAQEAKDKIYNSLHYKINPDTGMMYTEDEKQKLSAEGAAQTFRQNMAILIGPKFLETLVFNRIGKALKSKFNKNSAQAETEAGKASANVTSAGLSAGSSYRRASRLANLWKVGSLAAVGFMSEGLWEENVQLAISRTAEEQFGAGEYGIDRPGTSDEEIEEKKSGAFSPFGGEVGQKYVSQLKQFFAGSKDDRFLDDELSKSIGIGGLFGVGGGIVHGTLGIRQQAKVDNYWNNRINAATANLLQSNNFYQTRIEEKPDPQNPGKTIPTESIVTDPATGRPVLDEKKLKGFLAKMNNIQGLMDIVANTEDPNDENNKTYQNKELNNLARNVLFTNLAMEYVRAGKADTLRANLASVSQFTDKDVSALGYEAGMLNDAQKKNILTKMTNIVDRLQKADDWIENNVLDNVSEERQGKFGLTYTKAQKERRAENFEKKKAYLRGLAQQNALLDSYLDDLNASEEGLEITPELDILSSVLDEFGVQVTDFAVPLATVSRSYNTRIPALRNQISVLEKEFGYHWDNMLSKERNAPKAQDFNAFSKTNSGAALGYNQIKAEEALERMNKLQAELDELESQRDAFLKGDKNFELREEDGVFYVFPKSNQPSDLTQSLDALNAEKTRRINAVKREEIGIQKGWINEEWKNVAALKEPKAQKVVVKRDATGQVISENPARDTYFSRRMTLSANAYNTFFEREVMDRDNSLGQRKMKLFDKDPSKLVTAKKYKNNEEKLLKAVRIQGKVQTILAEVNGQKLVAELSALLEKDLSSKEFAEELKRITDIYNGKLMVVSPQDKSLVDEQISDTEDERNFVASIFEYMPEDDRFNEKYYNIGINGEFVIKPEYDGMQELAQVQRELNDRVDDLRKIKKFLDSIPENIPGDWNNILLVKKRIANVYTETSESIINLYNQMSNNGASEIAGDSLSTKQDLDLIDQEIDELGQLKVIFEDRDKIDSILSTPEFQGFIADLDKKIEDLKKIREIVKERLSSRLRENQDFLIDAINNQVEQLGLNFDGSTQTEPLKNTIEKVVKPELFGKLQKTLSDLKALMEKEEQDSEDKKAISDAYWTLSGQVAAIQEVIKKEDKDEVIYTAYREKRSQIQALKDTALMTSLKDESYYQQLVDNLDDSILGVLQILFYQSKFSQVGIAGDTDNKFLDDQPASPIYKFREDYNLRKLIRNLERDNSRTTDNTEVSKEDLQEFLAIAKKIQNMEDLTKSLNSSLNMLDQIEKERQVVQAKIDKKDNKYENLIVSSIQQIHFIRSIASFLRRETGGKGFRNWIYIQAPGGAGKTQTLGTWFSTVSGIPRDRVLATAFTEEAAKGIKKALLVGEEGPKDASEMAAAIRELTKDKQFDNDVLIIDEFPAIDVQLQKELFEAISAYTEAKREAGKGEFKVITMGDTNQLTFTDNGSVTPRPTIIINPNFFNNNKAKDNDNHPAKMTIIPSLTVNFRSNLFAITSFIDQFKGSNKDNVNATLKVASTDPELNSKDAKGVVSVDKSSFSSKILNYLKLNQDSIRTRALIVNETKLETYKKLLTDNGIKVITDPNDEVSKGVYVTTVKNSQGFSFDEVFVDLDNKDKTLFSGTSSPDFIYNKAMYVAASRARNLIVVTNFSNFENVTDDSINTLENKALEELQTKDADFVTQRDLEIGGGREILGDQYTKMVQSVTPVKAEEKVESTLDADLDEEKEKEDEEETEETEEEPKKNEEKSPEDKSEEDLEYSEEEGDESTGNKIVSSPGTEEADKELEKDSVDYITNIAESMEKLFDPAVKAYQKLKNGIISLLFPTGSTTKYKVGDTSFSVNVDNIDYENSNLRAGDRVIVVPFQQSKNSKSKRNFGYAVITPALDVNREVIENNYRTVAILSDNEIDRLKEDPTTATIYNEIVANESKNKGFISLMYQDVSDVNGFTTSDNKNINDLYEGVIAHSNSIKYGFDESYRDLTKGQMDDIIEKFAKYFYANYLDSLSDAERASEFKKIKDFYNNSENARIVIPVKADVEGKNPNLRIPPELKTYVQAGRPYLVFKSYFKGQKTLQFISLSRKYLDTTKHNEQLSPIRDFISMGKAIKVMLERKGVKESLGYSKNLSNMLAKIANDYVRNPNEDMYDAKGVAFSNIEAERVYNFYALYSEPNTQLLKAENDKEIENLTKVSKARNYTFEDGETIYGLIESYDPTTKTFVVKDVRSGESSTKSGVISHTGKSYVGKAQEALDNIMNANGNIASKFTSRSKNIGFVTNKSRTKEDVYIGYKFMGLLGSKTAPVPKSYNSDGTVKENFEDVIEILEELFNFGVTGELPEKQLNTINDEGNQETVKVKFRVPVPLNARNENGELEYDYTNSPQNTSRDQSIPNGKFFETNFAELIPTMVFVDFSQKKKTEEDKKEEKPGQKPGQDVQDKKETEETPPVLVKNLTKDDINTLTFDEIEERLSKEDKDKLDAFAKKEGFTDVDQMFEILKSSIPSEQDLFRDYLIECLL